MKLYKKTLIIYALSGFTPYLPKKYEKVNIFPDFSDFFLMVSSSFLQYSSSPFIIRKCEKNVLKKKHKKNRIFFFQHSILFFENGQK